MTHKAIFRAGTSGLVLSEPNKKAFPVYYQDKSRLTYYSSIFNSIEINSSFYKVPKAVTFKKWAEQVPDGFEFTVKLWKGITHNKDLHFNKKDVDDFMNAANELGDKKGCILVQYPASAKDDIKKIEKLLRAIHKPDRKKEWRIAVEFRHPNWYREDVHTLLKKYKASLVLHDMPKSAITVANKNDDFIYLRFHGEKGDYRGSYSNAFLDQKAGEIKSWMQQDKDVYCYFNNTIGDAVGNLKTLNHLVD